MTIDLEKNKELFNGSIVVQIPNDPASGHHRVIDVYAIGYDERWKEIKFGALMHYFNEKGEYISKFTHEVRQRDRKWKVDNSYVVEKVGEKGQPILDEEDNPVKEEAYNNFFDFLLKNLSPMMRYHIQKDAAKGLYDE